MDFGSILGSVLGNTNASASTGSVESVIAALSSGLNQKDANGNIDWSGLLKSLVVTAGPVVVAKALSMIKSNTSQDKNGLLSSSLANISEEKIANIAGVAGVVLQSIFTNNNKK